MSEETYEESQPLWGDAYDAESDLKLAQGHQAVVTGTDWTVETILSQMRRGNFDLSPKFQRRDAWDAVRKSRFIESLILQLPVPQIVLAEKANARGQYIVLDGKQRLLAIQQFASSSSLDSGMEEFRPLRLTGLDIRPELKSMSLANLEESVQFLDDLNSFLNQTIRTVVVRSWPDEDFLNLIFLRLNTGSVGLSPQELRQALAPGPFTEFLDAYASNSRPLKKALNIQRPDFRMRDVEIALRFFAFDFFLENYQGNLKRFLDDTTLQLNIEWPRSKDDVEKSAKSLDAAIGCTLEIFGSNAFRRWTTDGYQRNFNRAVFDTMTYYFKSTDVRERALAKPSAVERAFQNLNTSDADFNNSIQTTTKTLTATLTRLQKWGHTLEQTLDIALPALDDVEQLMEKHRQ
ncbi:hypothetical protein StoSoilB19_10180 [Arthrobacter sp. StoSoilB19]|uniref:DUF262 domain-containing protein n=1 Tax=Arthrobacter sp. StoSoilB19 TaxID=2830994 RepID=UPI001CC3C2A0|nr:DUF262 domain-containing protein [Arthrobacter sp. StoSoilB19]BCW53644.1 hypothetical protein StoSoilB19_10180 [Arthrobacter sp. StoSoilB19]